MMPAGKYIICDLCYVIDDRWDEVCSKLFSDENFEKKKSERTGEFVLEDGIKFACYSTAWGDGCYDDNYGNSYGVDAGVIGCIKVDDLYKMGEAPSSLGTIHEFSEDFETGYDDGVITFGHVRIDTDMSIEEEEVPEYCCCSAQGGARCVCEENDEEEDYDEGHDCDPENKYTQKLNTQVSLSTINETR